LYIPDFSGLGPFKYDLNLVRGHLKAVWCKNESQEFKFSFVKFTFVFTSIQSILSESPEYFLDLFLMILLVVGVDKDVIQVN